MNIMLVRVISVLVIAGCAVVMRKTKTEFLKILCVFGIGSSIMFLMGTIM